MTTYIATWTTKFQNSYRLELRAPTGTGALRLQNGNAWGINPISQEFKGDYPLGLISAASLKFTLNCVPATYNLQSDLKAGNARLYLWHEDTGDLLFAGTQLPVGYEIDPNLQSITVEFGSAIKIACENVSWGALEAAIDAITDPLLRTEAQYVWDSYGIEGSVVGTGPGDVLDRIQGDMWPDRDETGALAGYQIVRLSAFWDSLRKLALAQYYLLVGDATGLEADVLARTWDNLEDYLSLYGLGGTKPFIAYKPMFANLDPEYNVAKLYPSPWDFISDVIAGLPAVAAFKPDGTLVIQNLLSGGYPHAVKELPALGVDRQVGTEALVSAECGTRKETRIDAGSSRANKTIEQPVVFTNKPSEYSGGYHPTPHSINVAARLYPFSLYRASITKDPNDLTAPQGNANALIPIPDLRPGASAALPIGVSESQYERWCAQVLLAEYASVGRLSGQIVTYGPAAWAQHAMRVQINASAMLPNIKVLPTGAQSVALKKIEFDTTEDICTLEVV